MPIEYNYGDPGYNYHSGSNNYYNYRGSVGEGASGSGDHNYGFTDYSSRPGLFSTALRPFQALPTVAAALVALANAPKNACRDGFVYIPAGAFLMGREDGESYERPVRTISTDAYCIAKSETTNAQYRTQFPGPPLNECSRFDGANKPVVFVGWKDADAYCKAIGGRLPTEAEWEKAARGPKDLAYGTQSGELSVEEVNYGNNDGWTVNVCRYPINDYGLCDATGNVWEWTNDWYAAGAYEFMKSQNPQGPYSGTSRVLRGGSWSESAGSMSAAYREYGYSPDHKYSNVGFRCVVAPQDSEK